MQDNSELSRLLVSIASGDKKALERLWAVMKTGLYSFILFYIHDRQLAEDALSETFISIYKSAGGFKRNKNARAWIYTIARNTTVSLMRKQKEKAWENDSMEDISDQTDIEIITGQKDELQRLLDSLDETSRRIVLMHAVNDLKHSEIAKILSLPIGTVYRRYSQSIRKLKKLYTLQILEEVQL